MSSPLVYLASQSPRRSQLLAQIGVAHELLLPDPDEDAEALEAPQRGEAPEAYVQRVTRAKLDAALARWRRRRLPPAPLLAADTTVALGRRLLGKPADADDARLMLRLLSGRTHRVLTALAMCWPAADASPPVLAALSISRVRWRALTAAEVEAYVASGEPLGKAGGYAIQSGAARWTTQIAGSYSGIMGLPLHEVDRLLAACRPPA
jgi:septum formation protein